MRKTLILGLLALFIIIPISDALAYGTDYRYTGQQRDANSNLYYYGQRYYDPHTGKFTQTDPVVKFLHDPEILNKATNERLQEILAIEDLKHDLRADRHLKEEATLLVLAAAVGAKVNTLIRRDSSIKQSSLKKSSILSLNIIFRILMLTRP